MCIASGGVLQRYGMRMYALQYAHIVQSLIIADVAPKTYATPAHSRFRGYIEAMLALEGDIASMTSTVEARQHCDTVLRPLVTVCRCVTMYRIRCAQEMSVRAFLLTNLTSDGAGVKWKPNLRALLSSLDDLIGWPGEDVGDRRYDGRVMTIAGADSDYIT